MTFVNISLEQMRHAFGKTSTQGRRWVEGVVGNEIVFDFAFRPNVTIRVYTSIAANKNVARKKGQDPIRVAAFNPITDKGIVKAPHVKRVAGWRENLAARLREVKSLVVERMGPPNV